MENQQLKSPSDSVEARHQLYDFEVAAIETAGFELLWKAREALKFYEAMPEIISHEQAHEAANELRMKVIPRLEYAYQNVFTCLEFRRQQELAGVTEPQKISNWYDEYLPGYRVSQRDHRQTLENLPAWSVIVFPK